MDTRFVAIALCHAIDDSIDKAMAEQINTLLDEQKVLLEEMNTSESHDP